MAREPFDIVIDCGNVPLRREFVAGILALDGIWRFKGEPKRNSRSLRQLAFYFAAIVTPLYHHCRENRIEGITCKLDAHEMLKRELLAVDVANPDTVEIWSKTTGSTKRLTVEQMGRYIEDCRDWILKRTGIDTLKYVDEGPTKTKREKEHA